jgi:hypothetical protein
MSERIEIGLYVRSSETGELCFILKSEPSEERKAKLLWAWNYQLQERENTWQPLGEARIIGSWLIVKESELDSETWQKNVVLKTLAHVNKDSRHQRH